jgi:hypothetical protein
MYLSANKAFCLEISETFVKLSIFAVFVISFLISRYLFSDENKNKNSNINFPFQNYEMGDKDDNIQNTQIQNKNNKSSVVEKSFNEAQEELSVFDEAFSKYSTNCY